MSDSNKKHINELLKRTVNLLKVNGVFLENLGLFQGKLFFAPFFYLYSHNTGNLSHKRIVENSSNRIFKNTYVNTKKNCIHVLCKNDWESFTPAGC
jgi:hypothetical protein